MAIRKTSVAIDDELLSEAKDALGTKTVRETIHASLLEVLRHRARLAEVEALTTLQGLDLADEEVMAGAWRS